MTRPILPLICLSALILPSAVFANDDSENPPGLLREVSWKEVFTEETLPKGLWVTISEEHGSVLRCEAKDDQPQVFQLVEIDNPGITERHYKIVGKVRYSDVRKPGYLEMWSFFGPKGQFFSRTLGDTGPMGRIEGNSNWRSFSLPFYINVSSLPEPEKLEVNLVLLGGGEVEITDLQLIEGKAGLTGSLRPGVAHKVGGCIGALFGILGGIYGWSRQSGKGWHFIKYFPVLFYVAGASALILAAAFYARGSNGEAAYVSALLGFIILAVTLANEWSTYRTRQGSAAVAEERQMQALDAS